MITVLICVQHYKLETALRHYVSQDQNFRVIASRNTITAALPIVLNLEPDLFLIEEAQQNQVLAALNSIKNNKSHTLSIVLNAVYTAEHMLSYLRAGAYDVIPSHTIGENLSERLRDFSDYFLGRYSEQSLYCYHHRIFDNLLFDSLFADTEFAPFAVEQNPVDVSDVVSELQLSGWFRAVYISMNSNDAQWPDFNIHDLKIVEKYLRKTVTDKYQSHAVISGSFRLILIVNQSEPFDDLMELCRQLQYFVMMEPGIRRTYQISFGIGICDQGVPGLISTIRSARYASLARLSEGNGHIISYDQYFGDRIKPLDFLTDIEKRKLIVSIEKVELDACIRAITDIFSLCGSAEFILKASAILMVMSEAFERKVVMKNEYTSAEIETLQSMPPFFHLLKDSAQVERELKSWVIKCFHAMNQDTPGDLPEKMILAKRYIAGNYLHDIDLQSVADYVGLSVPYFCTEFHKACGNSFVKYLNDMRLQRAAELLVVSNRKINEIAALVGFQDSRHFSRSFQKKYSKTPSQYRSDNQKGAGT